MISASLDPQLEFVRWGMLSFEMMDIWEAKRFLKYDLNLNW